MRGWTLVALLAALSLGASPAAAQRRAPQSAEMDAAVAQLAATDRGSVQAGLEALGLLGRPGAVRPIADRIRRGLPSGLLDQAVDTLGILGRPEAGPVLLELTGHRRASVRRRAVQALVAVRAPGAQEALTAALSDADPEVRSAAAEGLGSLGATAAADALFRAFERDVDGAGLAIAQVAGPAEVTRFLDLLGRTPFDRMAAVLNEMLLRDDLAERARLTIVHRVAELATAGAADFLRRFAESLPPDDASQLRRAAEDAAARIGQ